MLKATGAAGAGERRTLPAALPISLNISHALWLMCAGWCLVPSAQSGKLIAVVLEGPEVYSNIKLALIDSGAPVTELTADGTALWQMPVVGCMRELHWLPFSPWLALGALVSFTIPNMSAALQAARFVAAQCGSADEPSTSSSGQVQLASLNGSVIGLATVATALARSSAPSLLGEGEAQQAQVSFQRIIQNNNWQDASLGLPIVIRESFGRRSLSPWPPLVLRSRNG